MRQRQPAESRSKQMAAHLGRSSSIRERKEKDTGEEVGLNHELLEFAAWLR